jgi:hypothetical protein
MPGILPADRSGTNRPIMPARCRQHAKHCRAKADSSSTHARSEVWVSGAARTVWLAPTESHSGANSMQMQCRSNQGIPNKCIRITARLSVSATHFGTNPIRGRLLFTWNQSVADDIAAGIPRAVGPRDVGECPVLSPVLASAPGLLNTDNAVASIAMVEVRNNRPPPFSGCAFVGNRNDPTCEQIQAGTAASQSWN